LKERLRAAMQIPSGMDLVLGNGSDELIQMLALAVAKPGAVMLGVEPSFVMFRMIAGFAGLRFIGVPLTQDFALDEAAMLEAIRTQQPALMFIAYPNNPTGNLFDADVIARLIAASPGIVVVDEAYHAFAGASFMPRLAEFPNLLVMRTLSKLGLAGLRLGLLAGRTEWLHHIDKLRLPYNVNVLTQLVATEVLQHADVLSAQSAVIKSERARLLAALRAGRGLVVYPSDANFVLFRVAGAARVFDGLSHPMLADCLRVTVGTPAENAKFLDALTALC
jgi:histidinol-phosphate aminotransferase